MIFNVHEKLKLKGGQANGIFRSTQRRFSTKIQSSERDVLSFVNFKYFSFNWALKNQNYNVKTEENCCVTEER